MEPACDMDSRPRLPAVVYSLLEESPDQRALASKVAGACSLLSTPTLHSLAFHTITTGYHQLLAQYERGNVDCDLEASLDAACSALRSLFAYCPGGWSIKILKCIAALFGRLCACRRLYPTLDEAMKEWLLHPVLHPMSEFISQCTGYLVGMSLGRLCVEAILPICLSHSPHLDWMLAHLISLHPIILVPLLLTLSLQSPPSATLITTIEFLSRTDPGPLRNGVVNLLCDEVQGWREEGRGLKLLLRLAVMSQPFLDAVSSACLEIVTTDKIQALVSSWADAVSSTSMSRDSHMTDPDEGEVVSSDDEDSEKTTGLQEDRDFYSEIVENLAKLICQMRGQDASVAISHIVHVYREMSQCQRTEEEAMEEGEIVRVSPVQSVLNGCETVMVQVLHRLHEAAQHHLIPAGMRGTEGAVEFAVGLQEQLEQLCHLLMEPNQDPKCVQWLYEVLVCVCACSSELQVARTLSHLLASPTVKDKVPAYLYWRLQSRHPTIAKTTIAMVTILPEDKQQMLYHNLLAVLRLEPSTLHQQHLQLDFTGALSAQLKPLSHCLSDVTGLNLLPKESFHELSFSTECHIGGHTLSQFFTLVRTVCNHYLIDTAEVELSLELSIGHCQHLLEYYSGCSEEVAVFLCYSALYNLLSQCCDSQQRLTAVPGDSLLPANKRLAVSATHGQRFNTRQLQHTGRLQSKKHTVKKLEMNARFSVMHSTNLAVQLMTTISPSDTAQLASVLLDLVVPHSKPRMAMWPDSDEAIKYSLEWDLSVYRLCVESPVIWNLLDLITEDPPGLTVCASALHTLLTVLAHYWQRCRSRTTSSCPQELASSISLVHCLAKAKWIPPPMAFIGELFEHAAPHEVYQLLSAVNTYLKENFVILTRAAPHESGQPKDTGFRDVLCGILINNIHHFGHVYARFMLY